MDPQCSNHVQGLVYITSIIREQSDSYDEKAKENEELEKDSPENIRVNPSTSPDPLVAFITKKVLKFNSFFELLGLVPQSSNIENDDSSEVEPEEEGVSNYRRVEAGLPLTYSQLGVNFHITSTSCVAQSL
ncbi:hypothetical protein Tco_0449320 [Tanacetum coccineum]